MKNKISLYRKQRFLAQFEPKYKAVFEKLVDKVKYYSLAQFEDLCTSYINKFSVLYTSFPYDSALVLSCLIDQNKISEVKNSDVFLGHFKKFNLCKLINDQNTIQKIDQIMYKTKHIIIVDDYSGSGSSFKESLELLKTFKNIHGSDIHIFPMILTDYAQLSLQNYIRHFGVKTVKVSLHTNVIQNALCVSKRKVLDKAETTIYMNFADNVFGIKNKLCFGYSGVQDLIGFGHFTPNTTMATLHFESDLYLPLLVPRNSSFNFNRNKYFDYKVIRKYKSLIVHGKNYTRFLVLFSLIVILNSFEKACRYLNLGKELGKNMLAQAIHLQIIKHNGSSYRIGKKIHNYIDMNVYRDMIANNDLNVHNRILANLASRIVH